MISEKIYKTLRFTFTWLAVLALVVRGFIPLGYMPAASHSKFSLPITICGGTGPMVMEMNGHAEHVHKVKDEQQPAHKLLCPFCINSFFASNAHDAQLPVPFVAFIILSLFSAFTFASVRRFGNAAPRAPPSFS